MFSFLIPVIELIPNLVSVFAFLIFVDNVIKQHSQPCQRGNLSTWHGMSSAGRSRKKPAVDMEL
jgi:hypothetical protein